MNLKKLEEKREKNIEQRREFVKFWEEYIKNHRDEKWSKQQNKLINSQVRGK